MKKITSLFALLFLWIGAQCAWAQVYYQPKVSTGETVYEYYLQAAGNNNAYYCTTNVGSDNSLTFRNSGDRLKVKLVSAGADGEYNVIPTNVSGQAIIGVTGTGNGSTVTYYADAASAQNSVFLLKAEPGGNGYKHAYDIYPKGGGSGWNLFDGVNANEFKPLKLWSNGDQGSKWNFIPANDDALAVAIEEAKVYLGTISTILSPLPADLFNNISDGFGLFDLLEKNGVPANAQVLTSGYYRLKNFDTTSGNATFGSYLFSDLKNEFGQNVTLGNVPEDDKLLQNNYIWHITRDGQAAKIGIVSGQGLGVNPNGTARKEITLGNACFWESSAFYFTEGLHLTNQSHQTVANNGKVANAEASRTNPFKLSVWAYANSAGSCYTFEKVDANNIYSVVVEGYDEGTVTLTATGEVAKNGGFFYSTSDITTDDVTVAAINAYEPELSVDADTKTIKVVYTPVWAGMLSNSITEAQTLLSGMPTEPVIGYPSGRAALEAAIETAQNVLNSGDEVTENNYNDLRTAIETYATSILLPTDGSYVRIKNYARDLSIDNQNHPDRSGYMTSNNGTTDVYGVMADAGVERQTIDDAGAVWRLVATSETATFKLYNLNSKKYMGKTSSAGNSKYVSLVESEEEAGTYVLATTTAYPQFTITCTNAEGNNMKQLHASGGGVMNYGSGNGMNGPSAWIISEATELTVNLNKAKEDDTESYASVYLPFNVTLPASGVTANKGVANADNTEFTLTSVGSGVPAENGVILVNSEAAASVTLGITQNEVTADMDGNDLTGTLVKKDIDTNASYYFLGVNDALIAGMYRPAATLTQIPANKAYLEEVGGSVQGYRFSFGGETTGIGSVGTTDSANGVYYDLSGRRVQNPQKGVYILGNRKVVLK